jgi:type IVB pilus formation R64 PilN family outer membrane protein
MRLSSAHLMATSAIALACSQFAGCAIRDVHDQQASIAAATQAKIDAPQNGRPVVVIHKGSWLLGEQVPASKPQPSIYNKTVSYNSSSDSGDPTLSDIANWIAKKVGVRVEIDESVSVGLPANLTSQGASARLIGAIPAPGVQGRGAPDLTAALPGLTASSHEAVSTGPWKFTGEFGDFLNVVDTRYKVWSRYKDATLTFFRRETRTFTIASLPKASSMTGSISTGDSSNSGGAPTIMGGNGSSSSTTGGAGSSVAAQSGSGGQTSAETLIIDPWQTFQESAQAVAGPGAVVHADRNLSLLTVTGSPPQCDRLAAWVKNDINATFGKNIAIEVRLYQVQRTREDNYGWNLSLAYKSGSGHTGVTVTGAPAPSVLGTTSPMTFGASIVGGSLSGTQGAVQALSTLGNVAAVFGTGGVTQNGRSIALQDAEQQDHVTSNQSTLVASVGATNSTQVSTMVSGFTGTFTPKIIDGRIVISFQLTLTDKPTFTVFPPQSASSSSSSGATTSSVQLADRHIDTLHQDVNLKPGESLVLTGLRQQTLTSTNNGVGTPSLPLLGGGVDAQNNDTMLAVVITARLM